jgi:hypothetical protein
MASSAARKPVGTSNNGYYSNPTQVFNQSSRQFLSSRAGERASFDVDDDPRQRRGGGGGYVSPPPTSYVLPPLGKPNGYPSTPNGYGTKQQQLAAQMGRSSTAAPRSQPPPDRQNASLYPHHLLQSPPRSKVSAYPSAVAPYSSYDTVERNKYSSPSPSYGSSLGSPPPSSTASPPPPHPQSPRQQQSHRSHTHSHSSSYATDYSPSNTKLLPQRSSKRNSTGANGAQYPGPGAVGPALAGGIYPVLPKPPSVVGSAQPTSIARKVFQRSSRPVIDEDEEASKALNTYG